MTRGLPPDAAVLRRVGTFVPPAVASVLSLPVWLVFVGTVLLSGVLRRCRGRARAAGNGARAVGPGGWSAPTPAGGARAAPPPGTGGGGRPAVGGPSLRRTSPAGPCSPGPENAPGRVSP